LQTEIKTTLENVNHVGAARRKSVGDILASGSEQSAAGGVAAFAASSAQLTMNLVGSEKGAPRRFDLARGEKSSADDPSISPPVAGLFEVINKTHAVIAIKLQVGRVHANWAIIEAARPSFISVPPGESVTCSFDSRELKEGHLDVIVLHGNPNLPSGGRVVCDTLAQGVTVDTISPCAAIPQFTAAAAFKIFANDKNAILKVRDAASSGGGVAVIPRSGNALSRIGVLQRIKGLRFGGNKVDMETNCTLVKSIFSCSC